MRRKAEERKLELLRPFLNSYKRFNGYIARVSRSKNNGKYTILIHDVYMEDPNTRVSDHCWIELEKRPRNVYRGDKVSFLAEIRSYKRDYSGKKKDFENSIGLFDGKDFKILEERDS